jgi:hypothetical protein
MTDLDPAALLEEAKARTGLSDFGDPSFREPLERLLRSMSEEGRLHAVGRATQRERVIGLLVNRLRAEAAFAAHPEIADEVIAAPVVIVGLPRTGTTLLHRMMAADPRLLALRWWESRHPAPFEGADGLGDAERIAAAEAEVAAIVEAAPEIVAAHPMDAHAADEEIMLLEHSFFSANSEAYVEVPGFSRWLADQDQTPGYRYLRRLLQLVQWQKRRRGEPGERWVLKTPHHLGHLDLLLSVFPDARVVQTHRDPVQTIPSFASLVHTIRRTGSDAADPKRVGREWSERMRRATAACLAFRKEGDPRFLDVRYETLVADPFATIEGIYSFARLELDESARTAMAAWSEENARDKRPVHAYTLEAFGFTEESIRRDFADYRARFLAPGADARGLRARGA